MATLCCCPPDSEATRRLWSFIRTLRLSKTLAVSLRIFRRSTTLSHVDVAAEVCSILVAEDGTPIDTDINRRTVAISAEQLRRIPEVIAVAGGESKAEAIYAVLRGRVATSVVTDESAARRLIQLSAKQTRRSKTAGRC